MRTTLRNVISFAALFFPALAAGQVGSTTDILMGRVTGRDTMGVSGARIEATSLETGIARTKTTGADGRYTIVFPDGGGSYRLTVRAIGMEPTTQRSVLWLVLATSIYTLGELYLSPIGLSFVTKVAPARIVSMMMGVWFLASFIGNYMTGYLGTFYEKMSHQQFFVMLTAIGVVAGLILYVMSKPLDRIVGAHDRHEAH
jgi:hypothetical protein